MDDRRLTTDDNAMLIGDTQNILSEAQPMGNRTLGILGYLLFIGGFTDMCVAFAVMLETNMLETKPQFVGQGWTGLWFVAVTIVGFALMFPNLKAGIFGSIARIVLGQIFAQLGILLSGGLILWLIDTSWGGWWLGIALLVGSVALFAVGTLIALDKNVTDVSKRRG